MRVLTTLGIVTAAACFVATQLPSTPRPTQRPATLEVETSSAKEPLVEIVGATARHLGHKVTVYVTLKNGVGTPQRATVDIELSDEKGEHIGSQMILVSALPAGETEYDKTISMWTTDPPALVTAHVR